MGFQIHTSEMTALGGNFQTISGEYERMMPSQLDCPRGGSDAIDSLLQTTLQVINEMHLVLCDAIYQHGIKLGNAAQAFMLANDNVEEKVDGIIESFPPITRRQAEDVVSKGYLASAVVGSSADAPTPTELPSFFQGNLPKNLPREATAPTTRPSVPGCSDTIISGDYPGLQVLASKLYWFVEKSNPLLEELSRRVEGFCAPYNNFGSTVDAFYASYSEDASMMNGFNKIVIMIANVVDKLAARLATCESMLESLIAKYRIPPALFVNDASTSALMTRLGIIVARSSPKQQAFAGLAEKIVMTADRYRDEAAAELDVLSEMIATGGLEYYTKRDLLPNSRDHAGILSSDQLGDNTHGATSITNTLESELATDGKALNYNNNEVKSAMNDLALVSGKYAPMLGDLASGVKGVRDATDLLGRVQSVGSLAGTLTTDFEALAELAGAVIVAGA